GVTRTSDGGYVAVGDATGSVDFGDGAQEAAGTDAYLWKVDSNGNTEWSLLFGDEGVQTGRVVASDDDHDHIVFAGEFAGAVTLGNQTVVATGTEAFVGALSVSGSPFWLLKGTGGTVARGMSLDTLGNV